MKEGIYMLQAAPLNKTVPITAFNRGKAGQIFSEVKQSGMAVVIKNNTPECVLLSPAQYDALLEELSDMHLLKLAEERLRHLYPQETVPFEEVCKKAGISYDVLDDMDEAEFE